MYEQHAGNKAVEINLFDCMHDHRRASLTCLLALHVLPTISQMAWLKFSLCFAIHS